MRLSMLSLFLIAAAPLGEIQTASAQSPTTYPWCSRYFARGGSGATSCYFTSYAQCMTTVSGIGGYCFQNPYRRAAPTGSTAQPRRRRPA
jgi:Protein of unknown function (DUF3551)